MIRGKAGVSEAPFPNEDPQGVIATAKGSGFLAGGSFFEYIGRFFIALMLARILGPSDYGWYVLAIGTAALLAGIAQLGLDDAMVRYVAILTGRDDRHGLCGTIQIGLGISLAIGSVAGGALFFAAPWIAAAVFENATFAPVLRLVAVMVPLLTVSNVLAGIARGFGRMDYAAAAENVVMSLVRLGLVALLSLVGTLDVFTAVAVFGISDIAASVALALLLNRDSSLRGVFRPDVRRDFAAVLRFALPLWLSGVLRQFRRNIETLTLGALAAASSVGVFAVAANANLVAHVFLLSILMAVKPTLARLHDRGKSEELGHLYKTATRWALTLNVPFFVIMLLFPEALLSVFGAEFAQGSRVLVVLAFAELINAATGICGPMLDMTGHTRVKLANSVLWTLLTIASSVLLIPRWGAVGAATGILIAIAVVNVVSIIEVWVLERLTPYDLSFVKPAVAGAGALALGLLLHTWFPVEANLVHAAWQGAAIIGVYGVSLYLLGLASDDRLVLSRFFASATLVLDRRRVGRGAVEGAGPA